ncbi:OB-fold nucleic acid binding domain-containing protein [Phormidium pseudopriestleyi FRX01]|uniref:OB-fold nucleic acid binding domain-containing protein n=1 Tax=Phormidium pseudopriestleyi FRX01 TaxID=1759528 RepID=A0ABS3FKK4_9CYAN|nr:OB-fold nucleic acid binding domain-containing protein [Phormidium pseudopriestleyi]MBO0347644.1 OB-fold nucleic acid binding domain-containing protein [Phormidium pseudopriestleyi FRX01]
MKSTFTAVLIAAMFVMGINPVSAQIPIRELQRTSGLTISGEIKSVVGNEFILDDGTGQVIVDAGPHWYHQLDLREGERVTVVGKYEGYDLDAFTITRENGEVLQIRDSEGPPPWSGGRRRHNRNR